MKDELRPGYQTEKELWDVKQPRIERYINSHVIPFLRVNVGAKCLDVGTWNPRIAYLQKQTGLDIEAWDTPDLNFDSIKKKKQYDAIFAFDVLEHLQNCLWTVGELKKALKDNGSIYVNMPSNHYWLWGDEHYFEIRFKHFKKWIVTPLGLKVVRYKRIFFIANWRAFFIGVRPLWRVLTGQTTWRSMARSIFCWNFYICELKKA